jgi:hypothetical protein
LAPFDPYRVSAAFFEEIFEIPDAVFPNTLELFRDDLAGFFLR